MIPNSPRIAPEIDRVLQAPLDAYIAAVNAQTDIPSKDEQFFAHLNTRMPQAEKFEQFYSLFNERMRQMDISWYSEEYNAVCTTLERKFEAQIHAPHTELVKFGFRNRTFHDRIDAFASRRLKFITPRVYSDFVRVLCSSREVLSSVMETGLRKAILQKHTLDEFAILIEQSKNPLSPRFLKIKQEIIKIKMANKNALIREVNRYRNAFDEAMQAVRAAPNAESLEKAKAASARALGEIREFAKKFPMSKLRKLDAELEENALKEETKKKAEKISAFYDHLSKEVNAGNENELYWALQTIINAAWLV